MDRASIGSLAWNEISMVGMYGAGRRYVPVCVLSVLLMRMYGARYLLFVLRGGSGMDLGCLGRSGRSGQGLRVVSDPFPLASFC